MIVENTFATWNTWGLFTDLIKAMYKAELKTNTPQIIPKPKEKMMTSNDAITETMIIANRDKGNPKMIAVFLIFL